MEGSREGAVGKWRAAGRGLLEKCHISDVDVLGLLDLANSYCEERLKQKCEEIICQGISVDNVAMLYAAAIKFEAKVWVSARECVYVCVCVCVCF